MTDFRLLTAGLPSSLEFSLGCGGLRGQGTYWKMQIEGYSMMASSLWMGADPSQFEGRTYRLDRGDTDLVVLAPHFITELNGLPQNMISSRKSHASTLLGNLNGMNVVLKTNHHVKMLLNRITPALPELLKPSQTRIEETLTSLFPQRTDAWTAVKPVDKVVLCISRGITVVTFGAPTCDDPELVRTFMLHTRNGD